MVCVLGDSFWFLIEIEWENQALAMRLLNYSN